MGKENLKKKKKKRKVASVINLLILLALKKSEYLPGGYAIGGLRPIPCPREGIDHGRLGIKEEATEDSSAHVARGKS